MPNPKRKHSKSRTAKRRSQFKINRTFQTLECENCGEIRLRHRVCPSCGYYRGRRVVETTKA